MKIILILIIITNLISQDLRVVASTSNLAAIAKSIGKDHIKVDVIVKAKQNPHTIQVLPSYMMKISRADIYLKVGLSLDYWATQIIDGSRNSDLLVVDCSDKIETINKPKGKVDPSKGHLHPLGNPHYMLDPRRVKVAAQNILNSFIEKDKENESSYQKNFSELIHKLEELGIKYEGYLKGSKIISYHSTFNYLINFTGIKVLGTIEPLPGIPPTPSHLSHLIKVIPAENAKLIVQEDFFEKKSSEFLEYNTGINLLVMSPFVKEMNPNSYIEYFEEMMRNLKAKL